MKKQKIKKSRSNKHKNKKNNLLDTQLKSKPTVTYKDNVYANGEDIEASTFLVTTNDDEINILDRSVFKKAVYKNTGFGVSAQVDEKEYGSEWQTPLINPSYIASMLNLSWSHARCCEVVARDVTRNGLEIKTRQGYDDEEYHQGKIELRTWINNMLYPLSDIISNVAYDTESIGYGGVELIRESTLDSPLLRLEHLNAVDCKIGTDKKRVKQTINSKTVYFQIYGEDHDDTTGEQLYLDKFTGKWSETPLSEERQANQVILYTNYQTGANSYGVAPITKGLDIIKLDLGAIYFNTGFFDNYGMPAFAVKVSGNFKDAEKERYLPDGSLNPDFDITKTLRYQIGQQIQEVQKNPHSAVVLSFPTKVGQEPVDVEIIKLSTEVKEASFRLMRDDNLKAICGCHGMSKNLISTVDTGALGGNALEVEISNHSETKIQPLQNFLLSKINKLLLAEVGTTFTDSVQAWQISLPNLLKLDVDNEIDRCMKAVDIGVMTPYDAQNRLSKILNIVPDEDNPFLKEYFFKGRPIIEYFIGNVVDDTDAKLREIEYGLANGSAKVDINVQRRDKNLTSIKNNARKGLSQSILEISRKHR